MLQIQDRQFDDFADSGRRRYVEESLLHLKTFAPRPTAAAGDPAVRALIMHGLDDARRHGFDQRGPVQLWLELAVVLGSGFATDPMLPWVAPMLDAEREPAAMFRAARLHRAAIAWLAEVSGADHARTRCALERARAAAARELPDDAFDADAPIERLLWHLHPEKCQAAGEDAVRALVVHSRQTAQALNLGAGRAAALLATLHLFAGHHATRDPLHPWIAQGLLARELPPRQRLARLEQRALTYLDHALAVRVGG